MVMDSQTAESEKRPQNCQEGDDSVLSDQILSTKKGMITVKRGATEEAHGVLEEASEASKDHGYDKTLQCSQQGEGMRKPILSTEDGISIKRETTNYCRKVDNSFGKETLESEETARKKRLLLKIFWDLSKEFDGPEKVISYLMTEAHEKVGLDISKLRTELGEVAAGNSSFFAPGMKSTVRGKSDVLSLIEEEDVRHSLSTISEAWKTKEKEHNESIDFLLKQNTYLQEKVADLCEKNNTIMQRVQEVESTVKEINPKCPKLTELVTSEESLSEPRQPEKGAGYGRILMEILITMLNPRLRRQLRNSSNHRLLVELLMMVCRQGLKRQTAESPLVKIIPVVGLAMYFAMTRTLGPQN